MFEDLPPPKKDPTASLTKLDLERLSVAELADLKTSRLADITLIEQEILRKNTAANLAASVFK